MKKYVNELINKIGWINTCIYISILIIFYCIYSLQPYFVSNIVKSNGIDIRYVILTFISFISIAIIRFPNNFFLQKIRKYSKVVLWEDSCKKNYKYFLQLDVGEYQNLISEISYAARSLQYESLQIMIKTFIMIVTYTVLLVKHRIPVAAVYLIGYLVYFSASYALSKNNSKGIQGVLNSSGKINSFIIDYCRNVESIITARSENFEKKKFNEMLINEEKSYYSLQNDIDISYLIQQFVLLGITLIIFISNFITDNGSNEFLEILLILIYSAFNLSDTGKEFLNLMETKDRLKIALDNIGYDKNDSTNKNIVFNSNLEYMIKVDNIEVSYDNDFKLHDISLKIKEKEKVAIIGSNGCGKSTLLKTLAGLLDPKKGTITYGIDNMKGIRYYSQDTVLFDRSIYENIVYPNNSYSLKEVMKIVKRVKLDSLIGNEEDLFSKQPGDFGTNFSGGEKQKILLARALINKAGIMMFDEIESALDKDSEKIFIDILNNELRDSTVICVTHNNINNEVFDKKYDLNKMLFTP